MRALFLCLVSIGGLQGCSNSSSSASPADAGGDGARVLACPPATDAGAAAAADAGVTAKILKPVDGQKFGASDKVPLLGEGFDPKEGSITDPTRTIWNVIDPVKGPSPDGEGPEDTGGPYPPGSHTLRFDVSNKACVTAAASVTITVE